VICLFFLRYFDFNTFLLSLLIPARLLFCLVAVGLSRFPSCWIVCFLRLLGTILLRIPVLLLSLLLVGLGSLCLFPFSGLLGCVVVLVFFFSARRDLLFFSPEDGLLHSCSVRLFGCLFLFFYPWSDAFLIYLRCRSTPFSAGEALAIAVFLFFRVAGHDSFFVKCRNFNYRIGLSAIFSPFCVVLCCFESFVPPTLVSRSLTSFSFCL